MEPKEWIKMISQKRSIEKEGWDNLIILDACRYDTFEKVYKEYFPDKELKKVRSSGSSTGEWLVKTFPKMYELTYFSTNPYVNSVGIPLSKANEIYPWNWKASDHFSGIIDVWEKRWDEDLETVLPGDLNDIVLEKMDEGSNIIHYMQPHQPYISLGSYGSWKEARDRTKGDSEGGVGGLMRSLEGGVEMTFGKEFLWKTKKMLKMKPITGQEKTWRAAGGTEGLIHYYEDNLHIVLEKAVELIGKLDGKTVITADHGEAFGEEGVWFHELETNIPVLMEVPWLEV